MIPLIEEHREALVKLCRHYGVAKLEIFGSAATGTFQDATSDLDFIADFADQSAGYARRYLAFADALETLFGRPVDLLTERSIRNPYFRRSVDAAREVVYDGRGQETAA